MGETPQQKTHFSSESNSVLEQPRVRYNYVEHYLVFGSNNNKRYATEAQDRLRGKYVIHGLQLSIVGACGREDVQCVGVKAGK